MDSFESKIRLFSSFGLGVILGLQSRQSQETLVFFALEAWFKGSNFHEINWLIRKFREQEKKEGRGEKLCAVLKFAKSWVVLSTCAAIMSYLYGCSWQPRRQPRFLDGIVIASFDIFHMPFLLIKSL